MHFGELIGYVGTCYSCTCVLVHAFSHLIFPESTKLIIAKFHLEPPFNWGMTYICYSYQVSYTGPMVLWDEINHCGVIVYMLMGFYDVYFVCNINNGENKAKQRI